MKMQDAATFTLPGEPGAEEEREGAAMPDLPENAVRSLEAEIRKFARTRLERKVAEAFRPVRELAADVPWGGARIDDLERRVLAALLPGAEGAALAELVRKFQRMEIFCEEGGAA